MKEYNQSSAYKEVCSVIDDATMEIVFNVLETEIAHLKAGMEVEITPYANDKVTLKGTVTEVNPKIDENGMVKVRATTDNPEAVLVDGMNVSILAKRQIADKLIVPKQRCCRGKGEKSCLSTRTAGLYGNMSKQDLKIAGKCVSNRD